jgi:hypothetical protein
MFTSTSQDDILINFDDTYNRVGIKLSGGLDSAIVFYMLCKHITTNKLETGILPITLNDWAKPYHEEFSTRIIFWMSQQFPRVNILPQALKQSPEGGDYSAEQDKHLYETHQRTPFDIYFTGINKNPPRNVYLQFYDSKKELLEGPVDNRDGVRPIEVEHPYYWNTDGYWQVGKTKDNGVKQGHMTSINLLANLDKKGVAELYDIFDLRQTLMLATRSCENFDSLLTNNFTTHCHTECWWCHERHWGFD